MLSLVNGGEISQVDVGERKISCWRLKVNGHFFMQVHSIPRRPAGRLDNYSKLLTHLLL